MLSSGSEEVKRAEEEQRRKIQRVREQRLKDNQYNEMSADKKTKLAMTSMLVQAKIE